MTDDLERQLRDLLQHAQLPSAPDSLRSRLVQVATAPPARRRPAFRGRWLLLPIVAILVIALAASLVVVGGPPSQTSATARSGDFQLTLTSAKSEYANGEAIDVSASVEYTGPKDSVQVSAESGNIVYFSASQLDGSFWIPGTASLLMPCSTRTLLKGSPSTSLFYGKTQSYTHPLSAGTYRITAAADFGLTDCYKPIDLSASIVIHVSQYAASPSLPASLVAPSPTPMPSTSCGGFQLMVANRDSDEITVTINDTYTETVAGGAFRTIIEFFPPQPKPPLPWTVVVTRTSDATQIGTAYLTGPIDQEIIVSGGQMSHAPYGLGTEYCGGTPPPPPTTGGFQTPPPAPTLEPVPTGYSVSIAPGLHPKWTAEAAAAVMFSALQSDDQQLGFAVTAPRIIRVSAMKGALVPRKFGGPYPGRGIVWVVQAQGTFITPNGVDIQIGNEGYDVFDDKGNGIGFGMSAPLPDLFGQLNGTIGANGVCSWLVDRDGQSWAVTWPDGLHVANDGGTIALLTSLGDQLATAGGRGIGMLGSESDQGSTCGAGQKPFVATALVELAPF